jgi:hypothetical protein
MDETPKKRTSTWRKRLASLVAAVGVTLGLADPFAATQVNASVSQPDQSRIEVRSQRRFPKLVFRRTRQGSMKVADHWSHESHASHESHSSHYSSHS